mmetsp:Transcript_52016/g.63702  ORF Transcript_52016/g.63702 Transcript_52016/m.63702 type:complete len:207 (+) Transcript_52016:97-717(+)
MDGLDFFDPQPNTTEQGDAVLVNNGNGGNNVAELGFDERDDDATGDVNEYNEYNEMNDNTNEVVDEMDLLGGDTNDMEIKDDNDQNDNEVKDAEPEPTFLSVWQQQRKIELDKRRTREQELLQELRTQGTKDIEQFHEDRQKKIKAREEENLQKEKNIREDLQSVFQNGTIWEQVGRMVDLKEIKNKNNQESERMRTLLIYLKNAK